MTQPGSASACCHSAASDLLIDAPLASGAEDIPVQEIEVRVRKVLPLDDEYTLLHVQTPRTRRLRFLAGQSARLRDAVASCTLPIASCPCDDRNIHFHVPSDPEMCSAAERLTSLNTGDALTLTGPEGGFVLDAESDRPRLMIGAAAGLAPLKSIVEHSLALTPAIPVSLLLVETGTGPHCLHNLFRSWRDAMDNFSYECCDSGTGSASEAMRAFLAAVADESFDVYVSGPEDVIDSARGVLTELDVPDERIHVNIV